jgi:NAD(P)-dependent dehydrogenase (short-subunit alcohol dehydrogenase family)
VTVKTAVITGAGQGIGRAVARHLAAQGWHVHLVGRTASKLAQVASEIHASGGSATPHALDVTDEAGIARFAAALGSTPLDALVNGAGEALIKPFAETTMAEWQRLLSIHLTGAFLMTQALLPHLASSDNASIINIGSTTTARGHANVSAYTAAKTGLLGFTRALAAELAAQRIRVVMLSPGPADTPMRWAATPEWDRDLLIDAQTIAEAVGWLVNLPTGATTSEFILQSMSLL